MHDAVIIGGGIAGLSTAWELSSRGRQPLLLEAATRAGGVILTERVGGYVIDAGPDALLVQKPAAVALCRELGLGDRLIPTLLPRTAFILRNRALVPIPEGSFLGLPTRRRPFITSALLSWRAKLRMAMEPLVARRDDDADESIGAFVRRRFGEEAVRYLAEPLLGSIHAGDVEQLSVRALFPRLIDLEQQYGSVTRGLRQARTTPSPDGAFLSLPGGVGELVETLTARLPADTIRYDSRVIRVEGHGPFTVHLASAPPISTRAVVASTPLWVTSDLVQPIDPALAALCREVPYASTAIVVLALGREQVRHPLQGSGFVVPRVERRMLLAGSWITSKWPSRAPKGQVLLRGFVGGALDPDAINLSNEELSTGVFDELTTLLDIKGEPAFSRVYRWPRASAQHLVDHHALVAAVEARLRDRAGVFLTSSGLRGTGIPDCVADGRQTGRMVADWLAR